MNMSKLNEATEHIFPKVLFVDGDPAEKLSIWT